MLRKLRSGDPDAYQTFRKNVFYGMLLLCLGMFVYQPVIWQRWQPRINTSEPFSSDMVRGDRVKVKGGEELGWDFAWKVGDYEGGADLWGVTCETDWKLLGVIEAITLSLAFIFYGYTHTTTTRPPTPARR